MAANDTEAVKSRSRPNSVAIDDKVRGRKNAPSPAAPDDPEVSRASAPLAVPAVRGAPDAAQKPKAPSVEAGDLPDAVRKRYYADKAKWSGDPAFFTSPEMKDPAFRDQGRRLLTATESQEVVKDLVAISQHRGWDKIHVTGTEAFRRSVWLEAGQKGLEVRGYKPTERDLQELDRLRGDASKNTIAPVIARDAAEARNPEAGKRSAGSTAAVPPPGARVQGRSMPGDRAADSQMRIMEAVIRRTLFDNPEAVARVMTVARTQLDAHIAAGRAIKPAVVKDVGTSVQRATDRTVAQPGPAPGRQGREHKPHERNRTR